MPEFINAVFMVIIAAVIAVSMKIVGVLLITALIIIPQSPQDDLRFPKPWLFLPLL